MLKQTPGFLWFPWRLLVLAALPCVMCAQITYDGCTDIRGVPVVSMPARVNDVAVASVDPDGRPVIRYNPQALQSARPQTLLFIYGHECAHHALGHTLSPRMSQEQEADCWSIRTLTDKGILSDSDVSLIQMDIAAFSRADWTHLPGPQRAINLRLCLGGRAEPDSGGPRFETATVPCTHTAHSRGDLEACSHGPLHPNGDLVPCSHACPGPFGAVPCHQADAVPCMHAVHPAGDLTPCTHLLHPNGDSVRQRVR